MKLQQHQISLLLRSAFATHDDELTCEEMRCMMASYLEVQELLGPCDPRFALARAHVRLCADCREESEALTVIVRSLT
jgi:hypothetical protein